MPKANLFQFKSREQLSDSLGAKVFRGAELRTYANASIEIQLHTAANLKISCNFLGSCFFCEGELLRRIISSSNQIMPKASLLQIKSREQLSDSLRAKVFRGAERRMYANASIEIQLHTAANLKFRANLSNLVSSAKMPEWPCPTEGGEEDIKVKSVGRISIL
ncbi:hypothetical protein CEXT_496891 [Caerostris extrusa]|uniref:Uncharacterized protein n=1 Tax=Caerostris extrusa TaxID=172846 RepID=A0AAV4V9B7_CAEEX|nr:hypothetical protein CEXT_496891 [Caerostris extrusa]